MVCFLREDPSLSLMNAKTMAKLDSVDSTTDFVLGGMGQLHLEVVKHRLLKEYGLDVRLGDLKVQYKQTVTRSASQSESFHVKLHGEHHEVSCLVSVHPLSANNVVVSNPSLENLVVVECAEEENQFDRRMSSAFQSGN